jgi:hemoglobin
LRHNAIVYLNPLQYLLRKSAGGHELNGLCKKWPDLLNRCDSLQFIACHATSFQSSPIALRVNRGNIEMNMNPVRQFLGACLVIMAISNALPGFAQSSPTADTDGLFQDLGGKDGIKKIVADFLPILLSDARIKKQFNDADIEHLGKMLAEQFCELSGGPCKYTGKDMKTIHADLGISNAQFNALAEDLQMAMEKQGVSSRAQNKLLARLAPMQHTIVTK